MKSFIDNFIQTVTFPHFIKTWINAMLGICLFLLLGVGATVHASSIWFALGTTGFGAVISFVTLYFGQIITFGARARFRLSQVGMLAQILSFWLVGTATIWVLSLIAPVLSVRSSFGLSACMIVGYVLFSCLTGHIKTYKQRKWLPQRWPVRGRH
jgi:hypothetical protein